MMEDCQNERPSRVVPRFSDDDRPKRPPNPKQQYGDEKVALALIPPSALIYTALAMMQGAEKYGPFNWRLDPIESMTYINAAKRHLACYEDREEIDPESGLPHLGHLIACIAILIDAIETGNVIDTRPPPGNAGDLMRRWRGKLAGIFKRN